MSRPLKERSLFFGVHWTSKVLRRVTRSLRVLRSVLQRKSMASSDSQPKVFLWSKSGRRRSPANLKLLSASRADATAIAPPTLSPKRRADVTPPLLSRRRTLMDASDLDALERRNLNDVLERRELMHLAKILDAVPAVPSTRSSSASRSYSIRDADFGY